MKLPKRLRKALRELAGNVAYDATGDAVERDDLSIDVIEKRVNGLAAARVALVAIASGELPTAKADIDLLYDAIDWNRTYMLGAVFDDRADLESGVCEQPDAAKGRIKRDTQILATLDDLRISFMAEGRRRAQARFRAEMSA